MGTMAGAIQLCYFLPFCMMGTMAGAMDKFDQMVGIPIEEALLRVNSAGCQFEANGLDVAVDPDGSYSITPQRSSCLIYVLIRIHGTKYQYLDIAKVMKRGGVYWIESSNVTVFSDSRFPWCLRYLYNVLRHGSCVLVVFCLLSSARVCCS
nr:uncharacterized protein LOC120963161 [Aegilops tauschii subsp. strangulata]